MQLGFVEFIEPSQDPVFAQMAACKQRNILQPSAKVIRQWAKYFSSGMATQQVEIPLTWCDFFTA